MMNSEKQNSSVKGKGVHLGDETKDEYHELLLNGKDQVAISTKEKATVTVSNEGASDSTDPSDPSEDEMLLNGRDKIPMPTKEQVTETSEISDIASEDDDQKLLLEDKEHVDATFAERLKLYLVQNYRNLAAIVCLWIAYLICSMAFSLLSPFFPKEVFD